MPTGVVKFFANIKGFGFILPDDGSPEVFVHKTDFTRGLFELKPRQRVEFDVVSSGNDKGNGKKAANVRVIG